MPRELVPSAAMISGSWRQVLFAAVMLVPLATWIHSLGDPVAYIRSTLPPGQALYLFSKLLGLYALLLITLQLLLGLRIAALPQAGDVAGFKRHRLLGISTLVLVLAHSSAFIAAASVRGGHFAKDYVIPSVSHGFYRTMVSVGIVAFVALIVATLSRSVRWRLPRISAGLHKLTLLGYVLILLHSLAIGSESRMGVMPLLYVVLGALVLFGLIRRLRYPRHPISSSLEASVP